MKFEVPGDRFATSPSIAMRTCWFDRVGDRVRKKMPRVFWCSVEEAYRAALLDGAHIAAIVRAMQAAQQHHALHTAGGLVAVATLLVGDDPVSQTVLARIMLDAVRELDPDVVGAELQ
jgi:2-methylaconitate cis-trans-isomerase PrpF